MTANPMRTLIQPLPTHPKLVTRGDLDSLQFAIDDRLSKIDQTVNTTLENFRATAQTALNDAVSVTASTYGGRDLESRRRMDELQQSLDARLQGIMQSLGSIARPQHPHPSQQDLEDLRRVMEERFNAHGQSFGQALSTLTSSLQTIQTNMAGSTPGGADSSAAPNTREELDALRTSVENRLHEFTRELNVTMRSFTDSLQNTLSGVTVGSASASNGATKTGHTASTRRATDGNDADDEEDTDPLNRLPKNNRAPQQRDAELLVLQVFDFLLVWMHLITLVH